MQKFTRSTTRRNQVTIPVEVCSILGIKPRDKVAFKIDDGGKVSISAAAFTLESAYGSVRPTSDGRDIDEIIRDVKDEKAERTV